MLLTVRCALQDLSGRPHLSFDVETPTDRIGTYDTQLLEHFFQSVANTSGMTLHIRHVPASCNPKQWGHGFLPSQNLCLISGMGKKDS